MAKRLALKNKSRVIESRYDQTHSPIMTSFSVDLDQVVLNQFASFHILAEGSRAHDALSAVIPSLYASARSTSPCTPAILAFAWVLSAPFATPSQRMGAARQKYGEAVVKLRDALKEQRTAKADDALFTVLLLFMLENITATAKSMPDPRNHIKGAIMLVNIRGLQNFASDVARRLFHFVKVTLTALPAWHKTAGVRFSDEVIEADRSASTSCESPALGTRLGHVAFGIAVLREKLDRACLDPSNPQTVREIHQRNCILDQELMAWRISVPREWETFSFVSPDERKKRLEYDESARAPTWLGYTASYPDLATATLLNSFRMHSIAIQAIAIRCTNWIAQYHRVDSPGPEVPVTESVTTAHDSSIDLKAQKVIRTMVDGICASVPFHLDQLGLNGRNESLGSHSSGKPSKRVRLTEIDPTASNKSHSALGGPPARGFMLLQPLVVAYSTPGIPADQKRWILGKTLEVSKQIGTDEEMVEKVLKRHDSS